jgi:hypothetical protein
MTLTVEQIADALNTVRGRKLFTAKYVRRLVPAIRDEVASFFYGNLAEIRNCRGVTPTIRLK